MGESAAATEFGRDVKLAPFVVKGEKISLAVHARTKSDHRYATDFAEEVLKVAYETMDKSTGSGLVIVGREGEPHPVVMIQKFMAMAEAGQLEPAVAAQAKVLGEKLTSWKASVNLDKPREPDAEGPAITFEMIMPALPVPLQGIGAKLYQVAWAEQFDEARVAARLRTLTLAELEGTAFGKYDWVFYLPPRSAGSKVFDQMLQEVIRHEKMGLFKRAAIRSAMVLFRPAVKKAIEGFRQAMLYTTVLHARSGWDPDDIKALTNAYLQVLMPDFKFNDSEEKTHERIMAAIERQKQRNIEYAKNPFVSPARLATYDPAAYTACLGDYGALKKTRKQPVAKADRALVRRDDAWLWEPRQGKPTELFPAGDRLFVSADGKLTVEFKVDEQGAVTAAEERRVRYRWTVPRVVAEAKAAPQAPRS